jgi:hypothetical protein
MFVSGFKGLTSIFFSASSANGSEGPHVALEPQFGQTYIV